MNLNNQKKFSYTFWKRKSDKISFRFKGLLLSLFRSAELFDEQELEVLSVFSDFGPNIEVVSKWTFGSNGVFRG